jgi:hypothetical protein
MISKSTTHSSTICGLKISSVEKMKKVPKALGNVEEKEQKQKEESVKNEQRIVVTNRWEITDNK